jgi:hypothetical protein
MLAVLDHHLGLPPALRRSTFVQPEEMENFLKRKYYSVFMGASREEIYIREFPLKKNVKAELVGLIERGLNLLYIYSGGVPEYYNYRRQFEDMFRPIHFQGKVQLEYFEGAGHSYTLLGDRDKLVTTILNWMQAHYKK